MARNNGGNEAQVADLLYQALETELGGVEVYKTALRCAIREDLKEEWAEYLEPTQNHVRIMRDEPANGGLSAQRERQPRRRTRS